MIIVANRGIAQLAHRNAHHEKRIEGKHLMKNRFNVFTWEIMSRPVDRRDTGGSQQFGLTLFEIFEDSRVMQAAGGIGIGPADSAFQFNRSHFTILSITS